MAYNITMMMITVCAIVIAIWLVSCQISASVSSMPKKHDPIIKIKTLSRRIFNVSRRLWVPSAIGVFFSFIAGLSISKSDLIPITLHDTVLVLSIIIINLSISWLVASLFHHRSMKYIIGNLDRHYENKSKINELELKANTKDINLNSNPMLNIKPNKSFKQDNDPPPIKRTPKSN